MPPQGEQLLERILVIEHGKINFRLQFAGEVDLFQTFLNELYFGNV